VTNDDATGVLGDVEVLHRDGRAVVLSTLWHEHPIVLVLIRHFG
jgi:hypothetical protein